MRLIARKDTNGPRLPRMGGHRTIADEIFDHIVSDILSGSLRPGDRLSERVLVARFGASRTPVREAIKRLRERGFVSIERKGAARIREMDRGEIEELYALRLRLERAAAVLTSKRISEREIAELRRINRRFAKAVEARNLAEMLRIRAEFHAILVGATRNRWLAETLVMLRDYAYPVRHAHWQDIRRAAQTIELHNKMIASLKARESGQFCSLVVKQVKEALEVFRSRLLPAPLQRQVTYGRRRAS
jgi:DNA-binding GntR family transcriptional regulator